MAYVVQGKEAQGHSDSPECHPRGAGILPDSNREPLKLSEQKSTVLAAVKKQWKDQGERENKEENPRPRDVYVVKGIGKLSTMGQTEEGYREIKGKSQAGVSFQADKLEFYSESHAESMDFSVPENVVMKFTLLEIHRVGHFTGGRHA